MGGRLKSRPLFFFGEVYSLRFFVNRGYFTLKRSIDNELGNGYIRKTNIFEFV